MVQKQQIALFPTEIQEREGRRNKKQRKAAMVYASVPVDQEVALLKDLIERLKMCCLDNIVLGSEYVTATHWSKYLKRVNLNFEMHDLPKILLKKGDFVFVKGRPQTEES